ncbi:MAG: hypothetical protein K2Q03_01735 [Sphingobacteriaceae bacterium]|nr:hypothetical protein [Sphingobacteriaceae bacterium]
MAFPLSLPKFMKYYCFFALFVGLFISACTQRTNTSEDNRLDFSPIKGIKYYEVKRQFSNGLSFNAMGFQQEPSWIMEFISNDSVAIWSPQAKRMEPFLLLYDHGNVYNFANDYFRIKIANKDSLVLQRLEVKSKEVMQGEVSDVHILFYSKNYLENKVKNSVENLRKPSKKDTLFIRNLALKSNKNPKNLKNIFAARNPVQFISKNAYAKVEKLSNVNKLNKHTNAYDYLYPEYLIHIKKAYKNFNYRFSILVDSQSKMYVNRIEGVMPEDIESRRKLLTGIVDVYLTHYFKIIPGNTLGILHPSEVTLNLVGEE